MFFVAFLIKVKLWARTAAFPSPSSLAGMCFSQPTGSLNWAPRFLCPIPKRMALIITQAILWFYDYFPIHLKRTRCPLTNTSPVPGTRWLHHSWPLQYGASSKALWAGEQFVPGEHMQGSGWSLRTEGKFQSCLHWMSVSQTKVWSSTFWEQGQQCISTEKCKDRESMGLHFARIFSQMPATA